MLQYIETSVGFNGYIGEIYGEGNGRGEESIMRLSSDTLTAYQALGKHKIIKVHYRRSGVDGSWVKSDYLVIASDKD